MNSQKNPIIRQWLCEPLPRDVSHAIDRLARTDDAQYIAVMPDVHLSNEVCVGTVLATSRLIYPNAVGGDIGCGMAAIAFDAEASVIANDEIAARIFAGLERAVPAMRHRNRECAQPFPEQLLRPQLSDPKLKSICRRDGVLQLGTLGRGNHFLELQVDDENHLWLMVHSGSRAMGQAIRDLHMQNAVKSRSGLFFLDADTSSGCNYLHDVDFARSYARASRRAMVTGVAALLASLLGIHEMPHSFFDCDHNHVQRETHFGQQFWIHRKGASSAHADELGMIPGSMGTESYHVAGRGCADALQSSSHGAGRSMSRTDARKSIDARDLRREMGHVWFDPRKSDALRDEAPSAYKDVRYVMRAQRELTRIVRRLRPVLCYK